MDTIYLNLSAVFYAEKRVCLTRGYQVTFELYRM